MTLTEVRYDNEMSFFLRERKNLNSNEFYYNLTNNKENSKEVYDPDLMVNLKLEIDVNMDKEVTKIIKIILKQFKI